ncbi:MAG: thermonuclease family protein [Sphingorhabdus sp.]
MLALAWAYARWSDDHVTITRKPIESVHAADGDSFSIGKRKLRLTGLDAPEYSQVCKDAGGRDWDCGKAAQGALISLLAQPGLSCETDAADKYGRALAICKTAATPDIAGAQVAAGMAVSNEFYGLRDYGDEEDAARDARRGIWQGAFIHPKEWRRTH